MLLYRLLFVCHGNICRSPMAEFIMKDLVRKAGLEDLFEIRSLAARRDELGNDMYPPAKRMLKKMGVPFAPRKAALMTREDYDRSDLVLAMDWENMSDIERISGGDPDGKLHLLMDFASQHREVDDPWYSGAFDEAYEDILKGCQALLDYCIEQTQKQKRRD